MDRTTRMALPIILLLGAILRAWGINFGLPFTYHADEPIVINHAMAYGVGSLNPHFFAIPPLASYLLFFFYGVYFLIGKALHIFTSPDNFAMAFLMDPTVFYIIGRIFLGVLPGVATVYAIYIFGKRLFSEKAGLLSALFTSVAFLHVQNSHYIYVDIFMVLFIVLTCISSLDIIRLNSLKHYMISGAFAGIATAFKYNAAIVFIVIIAAHFINDGKKHIGRLIFSFCVMSLMFIALNPYSVLDIGNFANGILRQAGAEYILGIFYHLRYSLEEGLGIGLLLLGIVGMVYYGIKKTRTHLVFIAFPALFYVTLCLFSQPHERYALPLIPFFIVYAAAIISEKIKKGYLALLLITIIVIPNMTRSIYSDYLFTRNDTRTMARNWIENNIKDGSRIAIEHSFFCPRLNQSKEQIEDKLSYVKEVEKVKDRRLRLAIRVADELKPSYRLFYLKDSYLENPGFLFERPNLNFSIPELRENGIEYVAFHVGAESDTRKSFYQALLDNATLVKEFSPYKDKSIEFASDVIMQTGGPFFSRELFSRERNGYIIKIFKLREV